MYNLFVEGYLADLTYTVTPGAIYSVLELTLGVVNARLPTITPAITRLFGSYVLIHYMLYFKLQLMVLTLSRGVSNWTAHDSNSEGNSNIKASNRPRKLSGKVKGNVTRDFKRLEDKFSLHQVCIETNPDISFATSSQDILIDSEFTLNDENRTYNLA